MVTQMHSTIEERKVSPSLVIVYYQRNSINVILGREVCVDK
jgi:hypothetical protein